MNVLLITIDSLRADRILSDNGLTPVMDALASSGVNFPEAITHGHGTPVAFSSILTGTYPMLYGGCSRLSSERPNLARQLRGAGYDTVAFTSNPHLFEKYGYRVGFEEFNEYRETKDGKSNGHSPLERIRLAVQPHFNNDSRLYDYLRRVYYLLLTTTDQRPYAPADEINDRVIEWLEGHDKNDSFFAWVHYMDVHYPFYQDEGTLAEIGVDPIPTSTQRRVNRLMNEQPSKLTDEDIETLSALYDAETYFTDKEFGRLLNALRNQNLYEDTLVVVTSDHGEALGEHDGFGHYKALYEELVRVPLVIHVPGQEPTTVEEQVGLADLAPTILDFVDEPVEAPFSGKSLRPLIEGTKVHCEDERHVIGHGDPLGVRTSHWKYIWWERDDTEPLDAELFDLDNDPEETTDLIEEHSDVAATFDDYLAAHVQHARETADALDDNVVDDTDPEIEEQLEALGYR